MPDGAPDPIPLHVLGGYLGAGKTTLLGELLTGVHGRRVAVVVNDFGPIQIDAALIAAASAEVMELTNGCVCCSLADGTAAVIDRIRAASPPPDLVVFEASGVADPAAVAGWAAHPGFVRGTVTVCADVETVERRARDKWVGAGVSAQLRGADEILPTRLDRAPEADRERALAWLAVTAPGVPVRTDRAAVIADLLRGRRGTPPPATGPKPHAHTRVHRSFALEATAPVDLDAVSAAAADRPATLVRVKGILRTRQRPDRRTVVQLAGDTWDVADGGPWPADAARAPSRLVLIVAGGPGALAAERTRWTASLPGARVV